MNIWLRVLWRKLLKGPKGTCLQIFRMGSNPVISGWRDPVRDREEVEEEVVNIDSDVLLVLSVDCCLTGY